MKNEVPNKGLEWTNLLLGVVLVCMAFLFTTAPAAAWNAGVTGSLIGVVSAFALYRYRDWAEWSNLTVGTWAVIAPFLLGFGTLQVAMWTHVLIGISVLTIAVIQLIGSGKSRATSSSKRTPAE